MGHRRARALWMLCSRIRQQSTGGKQKSPSKTQFSCRIPRSLRRFLLPAQQFGKHKCIFKEKDSYFLEKIKPFDQKFTKQLPTNPMPLVENKALEKHESSIVKWVIIEDSQVICPFFIAVICERIFLIKTLFFSFGTCALVLHISLQKFQD